MNYLRYIHLTLKAETFLMDSVSKDRIIQLVGTTGLEELKKANLIKPCGQQLYIVAGKN